MDGEFSQHENSQKGKRNRVLFLVERNISTPRPIPPPTLPFLTNPLPPLPPHNHILLSAIAFLPPARRPRSSHPHYSCSHTHLYVIGLCRNCKHINHVFSVILCVCACTHGTMHMRVCLCQIRSYREENNGSRPISEFKLRRALPVLC